MVVKGAALGLLGVGGIGGRRFEFNVHIGAGHLEYNLGEPLLPCGLLLLLLDCVLYVSCSIVLVDRLDKRAVGMC